ncbi:hypothetical protein [uncultured Methanobacterium sp.]|uniref:hypothetical protein n=1 Tax=uncultured Methanobacterium sp. TaxID=176306 RepID=UPI002AA7FB81|nr:hypothetical protein [uncultured Methanobacterium sp.]
MPYYIFISYSTEDKEIRTVSNEYAVICNLCGHFDQNPRNLLKNVQIEGGMVNLLKNPVGSFGSN